MGFRFQRRFKLLPGVTLNLSKSGVSTSLGTRGAHVTLGHGQTRTTVGLPGSGISYTQIDKNSETPAEPTNDNGVSIIGPMLLIGIVFILFIVLMT